MRNMHARRAGARALRRARSVSGGGAVRLQAVQLHQLQVNCNDQRRGADLVGPLPQRSEDLGPLPHRAAFAGGRRRSQGSGLFTCRQRTASLRMQHAALALMHWKGVGMLWPCARRCSSWSLAARAWWCGRAP